MDATNGAAVQAQLERIQKAMLEGRLPTRKGGEIVLRRAQELAPVKTGFLRDSGQVVEDESGVSVEFTAPYAPFVEFGTSTMAGKPFLRPAIDETQKEVVREAAKEVEQEVREAL